MIPPELSRDLRRLVIGDYDFDDEVQVIAIAVRRYIVEQDERLERLDKVEAALNLMEKDGKTDILECYFKDLKTE